MYPVSRLLLGACSAFVLVCIPGCAKRIPVEEGTFEAQEKVVLMFANDRVLRGRIDTASEVEYVDQGTVYRATVQSVSEETIVLENAILERSADSVEEAAARLADSRLEVEDAVPKIVLLRNEIEGVDRLGFDGPRTLRNVTYWSLSGVILSLLLGERS